MKKSKFNLDMKVSDLLGTQTNYRKSENLGFQSRYEKTRKIAERYHIILATPLKISTCNIYIVNNEIKWNYTSEVIFNLAELGITRKVI